MSLIKAFSYSSHAQYKKCKLSYRLQYIDKIKPPDNYFQSSGISDHLIAEGFVKGVVTGVPAAISNFINEMRIARNIFQTNDKAAVEKDLAITRNFEATTYDDWDNVWCRGKSDLILPLTEKDALLLIDHKFGSPWGSYDDQKSLYALQAMSHFPEVKKFFVELWYHKKPKYDNNRVDASVYHKNDFPKLRSYWVAEWNAMVDEKKFLPSPSKSNCKYCHYASDAEGGQCKFNSKGE